MGNITVQLVAKRKASNHWLLSCPGAEEGTDPAPLCSGHREAAQQGGLWRGGLVLSHRAPAPEVPAVMGPAQGQAQPTVILKPQWNLLRQ